MAEEESEVLATGVITGPEARGKVMINRRPSGEVVARLSQLWVAPGAPDVRVYLSSNTDGDVTDGVTVELGKLTSLSGDFAFAVPGDADLSLARTLVVYCSVYSVTFGVASLEHKAA